MSRISAEWLQSPSTGRFIVRLKGNHLVRGEGANRSAATQAFLRACKSQTGLSSDRKSYIIRKAKVD